MKIKMLSLALLISMLGSLTTYIEYVPRSVGYAISASSIVFSSFILLMNRQVSVRAWRLLSLSVWYWSWAFVLLVTQLIVALQGFLSFEGLTLTIGYLVLFTFTYFLLAPGASIKTESIWPLLGLVLGTTSLIGVLGALGVWQIEALPWEIPIFHVPNIKSIFMDPNYFGVVAFIGVISSLYGYNLKKNRVAKFLWASLSVVNFIGIFLSYSRAVYSVTLLAVAVWFLTSKKVRWKWKVFLTTAAVAMLVYLAILPLRSPEINTFLQVNRGMTGREFLWPEALKSITERPLFGWGVGNVDEVVFRGVGRWRSAHNTLLDFGIMAGIPGIIALVGIVIASMFPLLQKNNENFQEKRFLLTLLSGLLISTQFVTFTPGGAGFASFIFALALGQASTLRIQPYERRFS